MYLMFTDYEDGCDFDDGSRTCLKVVLDTEKLLSAIYYTTQLRSPMTLVDGWKLISIAKATMHKVVNTRIIEVVSKFPVTKYMITQVHRS